VKARERQLDVEGGQVAQERNQQLLLQPVTCRSGIAGRGQVNELHGSTSFLSFKPCAMRTVSKLSLRSFYVNHVKCR
jgi:hypothetical protein